MLGGIIHEGFIRLFCAIKFYNKHIFNFLTAVWHSLFYMNPVLRFCIWRCDVTVCEELLA